jgi:hypothetical protein
VVLGCGVTKKSKHAYNNGFALCGLKCMEAALVLQWSGGGLQYTKDSPFSTPLAKSSDQPFGVPKSSYGLLPMFDGK